MLEEKSGEESLIQPKFCAKPTASVLSGDSYQIDDTPALSESDSVKSDTENSDS